MVLGNITSVNTPFGSTMGRRLAGGLVSEGPLPPPPFGETAPLSLEDLFEDLLRILGENPSTPVPPRWDHPTMPEPPFPWEEERPRYDPVRDYERPAWPIIPPNPPFVVPE